jgi:uncharacterized protein (DUF305 family)
LTLVGAPESLGPVIPVGRLAAGGLAAVVVLGILGFAARDPGPAPASAPAAVAPVAFNPTDVAWVQLMIPMDERLLRLLALAPDRSADPELRALADRLATAHRAEVVRLRALLRRSGVPEVDVHAGHDMPGMVPLAELARAATVRGAAFDRIVVTGLRAHLAQSAKVARSEQAAGAEPATRTLAAESESGRAAELARLP